MTGLAAGPGKGRVGVATGSVLTFLAFDYGLRRVGVATGNSYTRQAQPLRTIAAEGAAR